jgi:uncharacterized protein (TIGR02058 family)
MEDGHDLCAEGEAPLSRPPAAARRVGAASPNPARAPALPADASPSIPVSPLPPGFARVLLVETGWGCDQHGQSSTKAAVRACRNAIEFNSLPIRSLIPGGVAKMRVHVKVAVPHPASVDTAAVAAVFPYGTLSPVEVVDGGLEAPSYVALAEMGDKNDLLVIAVAAVTVGHGAVEEEGKEDEGAPTHAGYCE